MQARYITTIPALGSKHTKNKWGGDAGPVTNLKTRHFSRFTLFDQLLMAFRSGTIVRNFWSLFTAPKNLPMIGGDSS